MDEASAEDKTKNRHIQELTLRFIASRGITTPYQHARLFSETARAFSEFRRSESVNRSVEYFGKTLEWSG